AGVTSAARACAPTTDGAATANGTARRSPTSAARRTRRDRQRVRKWMEHAIEARPGLRRDTGRGRTDRFTEVARQIEDLFGELLDESRPHAERAQHELGRVGYASRCRRLLNLRATSVSDSSHEPI